jgi:hypothetical protein
MLMRLRQICVHPCLLKVYESAYEGLFDYLTRLTLALTTYRSERHQVHWRKECLGGSCASR